MFVWPYSGSIPYKRHKGVTVTQYSGQIPLKGCIKGPHSHSFSPIKKKPSTFYSFSSFVPFSQCFTFYLFNCDFHSHCNRNFKCYIFVICVHGIEHGIFASIVLRSGIHTVSELKVIHLVLGISPE